MPNPPRLTGKLPKTIANPNIIIVFSTDKFLFVAMVIKV